MAKQLSQKKIVSIFHKWKPGKKSLPKKKLEYGKMDSHVKNQSIIQVTKKKAKSKASGAFKTKKKNNRLLSNSSLTEWDPR